MLTRIFRFIAGLAALLFCLNLIGHYNTILETAASLHWAGMWWGFVTSLPFVLLKVEIPRIILDLFWIYVSVFLFAFRSSIFATGPIVSFADLRAALSLIRTGGHQTERSVARLLLGICSAIAGMAILAFVVGTTLATIFGSTVMLTLTGLILLPLTVHSKYQYENERPDTLWERFSVSHANAIVGILSMSVRMNSLIRQQWQSVIELSLALIAAVCLSHFAAVYVEPELIESTSNWPTPPSKEEIRTFWFAPEQATAS